MSQLIACRFHRFPTQAQSGLELTINKLLDNRPHNFQARYGLMTGSTMKHPPRCVLTLRCSNASNIPLTQPITANQIVCVYNNKNQ